MQQTRIYCDTNIYLDYLLGRKDYLRPLDEFAFQLFKRIEQREFILIISDHLLFELRKYVEEQKINEVLKPLLDQGSALKVYKSLQDIEQAKKISRMHWKDTLHALLAHKACATYLVTRNLKDYAGCVYLIQAVFPENL